MHGSFEYSSTVNTGTLDVGLEGNGYWEENGYDLVSMKEGDGSDEDRCSGRKFVAVGTIASLNV